MVASLRQFLILLLLLLQTASPLVHAHVGQHATDVAGLHLPTLETLNKVSNGDQLVAADYHEDSTSIVELGSAIKLNRVDVDPQMFVLVTTLMAVGLSAPTALPVGFTPPSANPTLLPPFLSANISRAPPR